MLLTRVQRDRIGIALAARAGYDPAAAVTLYVQAGQAPRQGHVNNHGHGHEHGWLNAPKASRPAIDESKAIALYSPRWVVTCSAYLDYSLL